MNQLRDIKIISARPRDPIELAEYMAKVSANPIAGATDFVAPPGPPFNPVAAVERLADNGGRAAPSIEQYCDDLKLLALQFLHREFRRRAAGRPVLPFVELKRGLVPFTDECHPREIRVRQCRCENWVSVGEMTCGFCGDPEPEGRTTRAWTVGPGIFQPLAPQHLNVPAPPIAFAGVDTEDSEDSRGQESEIDWGADYDRPI